MTARDIERDMRASVSGAGFISKGELARYLGQKNPDRVKEYLQDAFRLPNTKKYFIPDVAQSIYMSGVYEE